MMLGILLLLPLAIFIFVLSVDTVRDTNTLYFRDNSWIKAIIDTLIGYGLLVLILLMFVAFVIGIILISNQIQI